MKPLPFDFEATLRRARNIAALKGRVITLGEAQ